jgi:plastocyanin
VRCRLCAALACVAILGTVVAAANAAVRPITIGPGNTYSPKHSRVAIGDTVEWAASLQHPLRFDGNNSRYVDTYTRFVDSPGTIAFYCEVHGGPGGVDMSGTVTVNGPPTIALERETAAPRAGEPVSFRAAASDPNNDPVRIDWDLDGDGTFELVGAGATASASYAAGSYTVRAQATDDFPSSSTASHTFAVPGAGGGTPGGGGSGPGSSSDRTAPRLEARAAKSIRARKLRRRGVKLTLTPSEDGRLVAELRSRSGRRLGRATAQAHAGQATVLRVRAKNAKAGRNLKLRIVAIDPAGNRTALARKLRVR